MSNFLQRIAASVTQTSSQIPAQARLQPTLGSAFMPQAPLGQINSYSGSTSSSEFNETVNVDPRSAASRFDASGAIFPASESLSDQIEARAPLANPSTTQDRMRYETPLLPLSDYIESAIHRRFAELDQDNADTATHSHEHSGESSRQADGKNTSGESAPTRKPGLRVSSIQAVVAPVPVTQGTRESERATVTRRVENGRSGGQPEADEVHIHIGRIEVAAVVDPPSRSSAPTPRKSLSLDEYLRRGNGGRG